MANPLDIFRGTGVAVDPAASNEAILQSIRCNFDVLSVKPEHGGRAYDQARLWLRSDTRDMLGVFGNRRRVIQPGDFLEYFREFCRQSERELNLDVVGSPDQGRTFYMASNLGGGTLPAPGGRRQKGDRTDTWLVVTDYYGQSAAPTAYLLFNQLVCTNGMTRRVRDKLASLSHLRQQGQEEVTAVLTAALEQVDAYQRLQVRAQETRITMDTARQALRSFFNDPDGESRKVQDLERIYQADLIGGELEERQGNAWRLLNTVTQYTSHNRIGDTPEAQGRAFRSQLSGARARDAAGFAGYLEELFHLGEPALAAV